ncbi:hypothetical protein [Paractinoplanes brasiliensis]|uniref:Nucleic acid binding protein n=1 Tax=Paractinoplanes brasiliensis TaxID=52695 RepID=A0A4R6JU12_9ACTN|nr:hypothetical protein [Actinoplanes brasiliensis]TDO38135.1 hypothetical protein C8E87_1777 [Actinoplanes brasiliensis]GID33255.1 hypothetical protein Abr02nite_82380 [Actinoplanes brasiliensis]
MVTRTVPAVLLLLLVAAGCANNASENGAAAPAPSPSASDVVDLPAPTAKPTGPAGEPSGRPNPGATTITGTVTAGVEPNCLLVNDATGSHLLVFDDPAMRADAAVGSKVKISGRSEPGMMSTCQQGVPFVVTSVEKG